MLGRLFGLTAEEKNSEHSVVAKRKKMEEAVKQDQVAAIAAKKAATKPITELKSEEAPAKVVTVQSLLNNELRKAKPLSQQEKDQHIAKAKAEMKKHLSNPNKKTKSAQFPNRHEQALADNNERTAVQGITAPTVFDRIPSGFMSDNRAKKDNANNLQLTCEDGVAIYSLKR